MNWRGASGKSAWAGLLCWSSLFALLLYQLVDAWLLQAPWIIWLVKLLPLLIFVPGIYRDRLRSYIWLCFVSLLYFISLVERMFARPDSALDAFGLVAVVLLFISAMLYVRWRARELKTVGDDHSSSSPQ